MKSLKVRELLGSNIAVATDAGDKVFKNLISLFEQDTKVALDFEGVTIITTAFLNAAIGQLYSQEKFDRNFLNDSLKLINISPEDKPLFTMVVERAKEYFADKQKFEDHTSKVFKKP